MQPATMLRAAAERRSQVIKIIRNESGAPSVTAAPTRSPQPPPSSSLGKLLVAIGVGGAAYYAYQNFKPSSIPLSGEKLAPIIQAPLPIPTAGDPETISPTLLSQQDASSIEVLEHELKNALHAAVEKVSHVTVTHIQALRSQFHEGSTGSAVVELIGSHKHLDKLDTLIQEARNNASSKHHPLLPLADATSKKLHSQLDELENVHAASYLH